MRKIKNYRFWETGANPITMRKEESLYSYREIVKHSDSLKMIKEY